MTDEVKTEPWYSARCSEHVMSDSRFFRWGRVSTREEAEELAREASSDKCTFVVKGASERPALTKEEMLMVLVGGGNPREADLLPPFPEL